MTYNAKRSVVLGQRANVYHDLKCCDWTLGVDTLLKRYANDRDEITTLIMTNPNKLVENIWKHDGPLAIDNECRCQMGQGVHRTEFSCAQCKNLRRLIDLAAADQPFQLECGEKIGSTLLLERHNIIMPCLYWDDDALRRAQSYINKYQNLTQCGTPKMTNLRCISGDSFTIHILISWMIHKIFTEKGLPHIPLLYTSFVCKNIGYELYDVPDIGPWSELDKINDYHQPNGALDVNVAHTIILQLITSLHELSKINFSHGSPDIHSLIFTSDPISYKYDGVHVEGPITLQLTNLRNTSATFNNVHYFPKKVKTELVLESNAFVPEILTRRVTMAYCQGRNLGVCDGKNVALFTLNTSTADIYSAIRHIGFPLYVGSFDFYCFIINLMCRKSFFDAVINNPNLNKLWSMMWLAEDKSNIETRLKQNFETESQDATINIIRGAWLRCDIVPFIWSLIKEGW